MAGHLKMQAVWGGDGDGYVEISVEVSNGRFSGITSFYCYPETLQEFASDLETFPRDATDRREFAIGAESGYTEVSLRFCCIDRLGHAVVEAVLREQYSGCNTALHSWPGDRASLCLRVEAEAVRQFADELARLARESKGTAVLPGAE